MFDLSSGFALFLCPLAWSRLTFPSALPPLLPVILSRPTDEYPVFRTFGDTRAFLRTIRLRVKDLLSFCLPPSDWGRIFAAPVWSFLCEIEFSFSLDSQCRHPPGQYHPLFTLPLCCSRPRFVSFFSCFSVFLEIRI